MKHETIVYMGTVLPHDLDDVQAAAARVSVADLETVLAFVRAASEVDSSLDVLECRLPGEIMDAPSTAALEAALIAECERAMRQRDEFLKTGISTASHGGSHDTCFGLILRRHFATQGADGVKLNDLEREFLGAVLLRPGCKLNDFLTTDHGPAWRRFEGEGLVRCVRSWKWVPTDVAAVMRALALGTEAPKLQPGERGQDVANG